MNDRYDELDESPTKGGRKPAKDLHIYMNHERFKALAKAAIDEGTSRNVLIERAIDMYLQSR